MKKARKTPARKGSAKTKKAKPVNLTAPGAEVTGQGLMPGGPGDCQNDCRCLCGVRD